jgi:sortase (surface protein transpeptidase)
MDTNPQQKTLKQTIRQYVLVMAFVVCAIVVVGNIGKYYLRERSALETEVVIGNSLYARSQPISLRIPSLSIDTTFVPPLQLNTDQTITVPDSYTQVGWYQNGATPGENGTSVILGHVDSKDGPAIFFGLGRLNRGDTIEVDREDGTTAVFVVDGLVRYPQDSFPTEKVYGKTDTPTLRLVTCSGIFNKGIQRYSHNLVVYATLKEI